jgi:diguanylate cyclase
MTITQAKTNSNDIAREALRALVTRKLDPTPDNYRRFYNEIAGLDGQPDDTDAVLALKRIVAEFPRGTAELQRIAKALERAQDNRDWVLCATLMQEACASLLEYHQAGDAWRALLAELLRQLDASHKGMTRSRKKERLERALEIQSGTPDQLQQKLAAIIRSWAELPSESLGIDLANTEIPQAQNDPVMNEPAAPVAPAGTTDAHGLCELLGNVLDVGVAGLLAYEPTLASEAEALAGRARSTRTPQDMMSLRGATKSFLLRIELTAANNADLHQGMLRLLRLVIENVAELVGDDEWLRGQVNTLAEIVAKPLDLVMIEHAERNMKDAILRQGTLRHSLTEAKGAFKSMVSGFVNRLGEFSSSTGEYQEKIENLSAQVRATDDIVVLGRLLEEVAAATRTVQTATQRSHEETLQTQREVQAAEDKIRSLQTELARISAKVREDQLTGALNRRGLEEEYERCCAASDRRGEPLCVALLDIDNFKSLNDTHGHQAGDEALVHLANVIKATVRPTDSVCRYGGEEFVILLTGTGLNDAIAVISRLQRELTKRFFLHDNQRLLLTFSAGVAERRAQESRDDTIGRADAAMYTAKRSGKNRVVPAD